MAIQFQIFHYYLTTPTLTDIHITSHDHKHSYRSRQNPQRFPAQTIVSLSKLNILVNRNPLVSLNNQ